MTPQEREIQEIVESITSNFEETTKIYSINDDGTTRQSVSDSEKFLIKYIATIEHRLRKVEENAFPKAKLCAEFIDNGTGLNCMNCGRGKYIH